MRRLLLILLLLVPASGASALDGEGSLRFSGAVELRWHGTPGSCEELGLCGVRGVVRWGPGSDGQISYSGRPGRWRPDYLSTGGFSGATVRVLRRAADGTETACIDVADGVDFGDHDPQLTGSPLRLALSGPGDAGPLSAGRCAGPLPADFAAALPSAPFRIGSMDLRGRTPFAAGPFAGEVVSTLRATAGRVRRSRSYSGEGISRPSERPGTAPRIISVAATYRVVAARGGVSVRLAGAEAPLCAGLDACGATGTIDIALDGLGGQRLSLSGWRRLADRRPYGRDRALRDLAAGRLELFGAIGERDEPAPVRVTETVRLEGEEVPCRQEAEARSPELLAQGGDVVSFTLERSGTSGPDLLRTRCPGPQLADLGRDTLLAAALPAARLAEEGVAVTLEPRPAGPLLGAWAPEATGALVLELRRTALRIGGRR